jgi:hypothetical protein
MQHTPASDNPRARSSSGRARRCRHRPTTVERCECAPHTLRTTGVPREQHTCRLGRASRMYTHALTIIISPLCTVMRANIISVRAFRRLLPVRPLFLCLKTFPTRCPLKVVHVLPRPSRFTRIDYTRIAEIDW